MKIILSRKGFDSSFGGCASPIFDDGSFVSLPIPHWFVSPPPPDPPAGVKFSDIEGDQSIGKIVEDLTNGRKRPVKASDPVHLDPDLKITSLRRKANWRPLFGQADQAQSHLDNQGIGPGDIFLFFGWFREVEQSDYRFRFKRGAPDLHMFYGWLKVGDVWRVGKAGSMVPDWAAGHPHAAANYGSTNTIYVAAGTDSTYHAGIFRSHANQLVLTAPEPNRNRSLWRLPKWFHPSGRKSSLSYHNKNDRWRLDEKHAYLKSVGRGQEFVLDTRDYPEAIDWARRLIAENAA
jgi:hypothetical protein